MMRKGSSGPTGLVLKALGLTRKGSLVEATAAIQKALRLVVPDVASAAPGVRPAKRTATVAGPAVVRTGTPTPATEAARAVDAAAQESWKVPSKHGFLAGSHSFAGTSRDYKLFVPKSLPVAPALVVMLHGCTQSADDFAAGTRMNERATRDGFVVLYPEQSRSANPSTCWNWFQTNDQRRDHGEAGLIASLTRSITAEYGIDPTRVYVAGLSAGGAMAANLAVAYPDLFAAVGIHSGLVAGAANNMVDALTAMRKGASRRPGSPGVTMGLPPTPTIVFHGDDDRTVHPLNADQIVLAGFGPDALPAPDVLTGKSSGGRGYVKQSYRDAGGTIRVESWKLKSAGHAWAGGDAAGSYTDPQGVDATEEMLRFFAMHRLPAMAY